MIASSVLAPAATVFKALSLHVLVLLPLETTGWPGAIADLELVRWTPIFGPSVVIHDVNAVNAPRPSSASNVDSRHLWKQDLSTLNSGANLKFGNTHER